MAADGGGGRRWMDELEPDLRPLVRQRIVARCAKAQNAPLEQLHNVAANVEEGVFRKATSKMEYFTRMSTQMLSLDQIRPQVLQADADRWQQMQMAHQMQMVHQMQLANRIQAMQGANSWFTATPQAVSMMASPSTPPSSLPNQHMVSHFAPNMHMEFNQGPFDMMTMLDQTFNSKPSMVAPMAPSVQPSQQIMQSIAIQSQNQLQLQTTNIARCHPASMAQLQGHPNARPNGHQNHLLRHNASAYVQQLQPAVHQQHLGFDQQQVGMQTYHMLGGNVMKMNNGYPGGWNNQQYAGWAAGIQSPFEACGQVALKKQINMESQPMPPAQRKITVNQRSNVHCPSPQTPAMMESAGEVNWREEMFRQIKSLKDAYFSELMKFNQNYVVKRLTEEQFKSSPREKSDAYMSILSLQNRINSVLKFLQYQKSEIPETLRGQLPQYQKNIHNLLALHGETKACEEEMNMGQQSKNCPRQPLPQTVSATADVTPFPGGKRNQQKQPADASLSQIRQNLVTTTPSAGKKTHSNQLEGVTSPCSSINPPGGLQSWPTNDVGLCCTPSPNAMLRVVQVTSPDTLLKSTSQSPIAKPGSVAAASPFASVKSTLTSTVEKSGVLAAASPCASVKSASPPTIAKSGVVSVASPSDCDSSFLLHNNATVNGCRQATPTTPTIPASPRQTQTSAGQAEDQIHCGSETSVVKKPIDHLIAAVFSSSPAMLCRSVNSIESALSAMDSVPLRTGYNNKMKRVYDVTSLYSESPPLGSTDGSTVTIECNASDSASSGHCSVKRQKTLDAKDALLDEIEAINSRLIDTVISIASNDRADGMTSCNGGILIKLSYTAVALAPSLKSHFASSGDLQPVVIPVILLVPADYPASSPMIVDHEGDAQLRTKFSCISDAVDAAFRRALRSLPEPRSLKETAEAWDACVRRAITEYAYRLGGGTLSSSLGRFESCVGA